MARAKTSHTTTMVVADFPGTIPIPHLSFIMEKAKAISRASNQGSTSAPRAPTPKGIPELRWGDLPPHERILRCADNWGKLGDSYVAAIAKTGLLLDWIDGFQPTNPQKDFAPAWWESSPNLPPQVGVSGSKKGLSSKFHLKRLGRARSFSPYPKRTLQSCG